MAREEVYRVFGFRASGASIVYQGLFAESLERSLLRVIRCDLEHGFYKLRVQGLGTVDDVNLA